MEAWTAVLLCFGEATCVIWNELEPRSKGLIWGKQLCLGQWQSACGNLVLFTEGNVHLCIPKEAVSKYVTASADHS